MNIIVDTNIVFTSILSPNGKIHDLILNSDQDFTFFTPSFLADELEVHHEKLKRISKLSDTDISFLKRTIFHHIEFIDPEIIHEKFWKKGYDLATDIDEKDTPFVALTLQIDGYLWTGDKKLINGLIKKGVDWTLSTDQLLEKRK